MGSFIGEWVARLLDGRWIGLGHLVQSEITDRLVMKCGRQMKLVNGRGELNAGVGGVQRCFDCEGKRKRGA